jgi:hypothetical protein
LGITGLKTGLYKSFIPKGNTGTGFQVLLEFVGFEFTFKGNVCHQFHRKPGSGVLHQFPLMSFEPLFKVVGAAGIIAIVPALQDVNIPHGF